MGLKLSMASRMFLASSLTIMATVKVPGGQGVLRIPRMVPKRLAISSGRISAESPSPRPSAAGPAGAARAAQSGFRSARLDFFPALDIFARAPEANLRCALAVSQRFDL